MKAVFVSDVSPARGQVYGLRVASFAAAMARRGHDIVLLSPAEADQSATDPQLLTRQLQEHDWRRPLCCACRPEQDRLLNALRRSRLPSAVRRAATAVVFAAIGGVHGDWIAGARPYLDVLAECFRPKIVWGIFGNTSTLVLARSLAHRSGAHWFMDVKDNWDLYVPRGLRRLTAYRFRDAAGFTSNARLHGNLAARCHRQPHAIIYSSIATEMIAPKGRTPRRDVFVLTLIGGTYQTDKLGRFLAALNGWLATLSPAERAVVEFHYAGTATADVAMPSPRHHWNAVLASMALSHTPRSRSCASLPPPMDTFGFR